MRINKDNENNIKSGRIWLHLFDNYEKSIGVEWNLRFSPFNFYFELDGRERDYTLSFWCIWVFYIKFSNIFNYYPKEWNSYTNNKNGGYLDCAQRRIGICHYSSTISLYLWHDGDCYIDPKDTKLFYKNIWLLDIFCGEWKYHTLEESYTIEQLELPEKIYGVNVQYRFWHKKWKRFYMKIFNHKGKSILIKSDIKYPRRKWTVEDDLHGIVPEDLETNMYEDGKWFLLKPNKNISDAVNMYKDIIIEKRSVERENWVPTEYKKMYQREQKLKRILDGNY